MAKMIVERVASSGEPWSKHELECPDAEHCTETSLDIEVDIKPTYYRPYRPSRDRDEPPDDAEVEYTTTACGWPIELTEDEEEKAFNLAMDEAEEEYADGLSEPDLSWDDDQYWERGY